MTKATVQFDVEFPGRAGADAIRDIIAIVCAMAERTTLGNMKCSNVRVSVAPDDARA